MAQAGPVMVSPRVDASHWIGILIVVLLHLVALKFLISHRLLPPPSGLPSIVVDLIAPPPPLPPRVEPPKPPPPRRQAEPKPLPRQIIAEAPVIAPTDHVAPEPPKPAPAEMPVAPPAPQPAAPGPVKLSNELALACPDRRAPAYPPVSRRMGETGLVVLRVNLDEQGHVAGVAVEKSSGHPRLDDAAVAAVRTWRCTAPTREGRPVRAIALQPFNFVLEGV